MNDLYHHGIKGMRWGVRRTPEQLGRARTIRKGKTMYQMEMSGGGYGYTSRKLEGQGPKVKLKKDLKIPSEEEVQSIVKDIQSKDKGGKLAKENAKAYIKRFWNDDSMNLWEASAGITDAKGILNPNKKELEAAHKQVRKDVEKQFLSRYENISVKDLTNDTVLSLRNSEANRQAVIGELRKRGYNAMVESKGGNEKSDFIMVFDEDDSVQ